MRRHLRGIGWMIAQLAIGAAAALGQAPWGLWSVTLVAMLAALLRIARAPGPRSAGLRAWTIGAGYFAMAMFWIVEPFMVEPEVYGWMAPFALILLALGGGLYWAVPAWLAARLAPGQRARVLILACGLVLSDWIRGWLFTGLPWALFGHIWIGTPVSQMAALTGAIGLSALTMGAAALPLLTFRAGAYRGIAGGVLIAGLGIGAAWLGGQARLDAADPADRAETLRLVQPNATQALKWDPYWSQVFFDRLIALSSGPTAAGMPPDAVIWPESAVTFLLEDPGPAADYIAAQVGAPVLTGIQSMKGARFYNSFAELRADGSFGQSYDKFHLVPFGEYTPWGDALSRFGIRALAARYGNGYSPGPGPRVLRGVAGLPPVQVLICYEAIFARHILARGQDRPGWLLQITNDGWFGNLAGPWQHLAQAQLRAVESGLPMIRVANTGISAVIDAKGRIREELGLNVEGRIDARLPGALPPTIWSVTGEWPTVALIALIFLIATLRARRKTRAPQ